MAVLLPSGRQHYADPTGAPLVGGKLYTYDVGTTNPRLTFNDAAQQNPNTNPVVLDARGEAVIFWSGDYTVTLTDAAGNTLWTQDGIDSNITALNDNFVIDQGVTNVYAGVGLASASLYAGLRFSFIPANTNTGASTFNYGGLGAKNVISGGNPLVSGQLQAGVLYLLEYDGINFQVLNAPLNPNTTPDLSAAVTALVQGQNDLDQVETVVAALEAGTATNIATFGDSTMWGANPANLAAQVATPPYLQLQNFVNTYLGNTACTVVNYAISGTTLAQMLAGTDGSAKTFAARITSEAAPIVYCNHGVNDAFGTNQTTAAVYRANLVTFIQIVRAAGKTPVLVTPHPCLTIGGFGSQARAENTARFANIMRSVATQHGVILVDNNLILSKIIQADNDSNQINLNLPLNILTDGVHGPQTTYYITGNNLADAIVGAQIPTLSRASQRIGASSAICRATGQAISPTSVSRFQAVITTGTVSPQTMTICFRIGDVGLDLSYHHYIWAGGSANISVNLDGQGAGATTFPAGVTNLSQLQSNFGTNFLQDVETQLIRNIGVGLHLLTLNTSSVGAVSFNGLRVRNTEKPVILGNGTDLGQRQLLAAKFSVLAGSTSNLIANTDIVCSRFIDGLELEWTGQMTKNSGLAIVTNQGTNVAANTPQQLMIFGLNNLGYAALSECTGPAAFTTTAFDAVDHSAASHLYRVVVTSAMPGSVQMFIDDVSVGTIALTQPYYGGQLGCWKNLNTDVLNLFNISRVWRF